MESDGAVVADFLTSAANFLKTVFWFFVYPPVSLWNSNNIWCQRNWTCPPTAGAFSLLAWFLFLVVIRRLVIYSADTSRRNLVWLLIWAGCYYGLPQLYGGLRELDHRAEQQETQRRIENRNRQR